MANKILIKRRPSSGSSAKPTSLYWGELAFNEASDTLYYGFGSGTTVGSDTPATGIYEIGGSGSYSLRGGTNASGTWPISVTGNASTVTSGVYSGSVTVNGNVPTWLSASNTLGAGYAVSTDLSTNNSSSYIARADAIKSYVDTNLNNATVVRTTGNQTISGVKTFASTISGSIDGNAATSNQVKTQQTSTNSSHYLTFVDSDNGSATAETIYTDAGLSYNPSTNTLSAGIIATTGSVTVGGDLIVQGTTTTVNSTEVDIGDNIITVNASGLATGGFRVKDATGNYQSLIWNETSSQWEFQGDTANIYTSGELTISAPSTTSIGWIPVFDGAGSPDTTPTVISYITRANFLSDLGIASSGTQVIAGNGLTGGGTLETDITLDVGQGDGISVTANAIAVNTTVVRTTGNQSIGGTKTFSDSPIFNNGVIVSGGQIDLYTPDIGVAFRVTEGGTITSGVWGASTIAVNKGGTGQTSYTNGQLLIGNTTGNTLTKATLTEAYGINITNGNGSITIGVDTNEIVATTGTQNVSGVKTFFNQPVLNSGLSIPHVNGSVKVYSNQTNLNNSNIYFDTDDSDLHVAYKETLSATTFTAGSGLSGGGTLAASRTFNVGQGAGITVSADTVAHADTSTLTGAQGSDGIASITLDGFGHVTAVTTATYVTSASLCSSIANCPIDGGTF